MLVPEGSCSQGRDTGFGPHAGAVSAFGASMAVPVPQALT